MSRKDNRSECVSKRSFNYTRKFNKIKEVEKHFNKQMLFKQLNNREMKRAMIEIHTHTQEHDYNGKFPA